MGKGVKEKIASARLRKEQRKLLEAESQHSEFYWEYDAKTGIWKHLRRSSKKKKKGK